MSQYDLKKAPHDTALDQIVPTENIDVSKPGRFYPEEFSGQIRAVQQQQSMLAEMPKSLANITESFNDYRISTWRDEEQTVIQQESLAADTRIKLREEELKLAVNNEIYDKKKQLQQAAIDAVEQADIDKTSRYAALEQVYADYSEIDEFNDIPAAKAAWKHSIQEQALQGLAKARQDDIETQRYKAGANIQDIVNTNYSEVLQGNLDAVGAMQKALPDLVPFLQQLPGLDAQKVMNTAWNQMVLAEAQKVVFKVEQGLTSPAQ